MGLWARILGLGIGKELEKDEREAVHGLIRAKNAERLRIIALLTVVLEALLILLYDLPALNTPVTFDRWLARGYLIAHGSILVVALSGWMILFLLKRDDRIEAEFRLYDRTVELLISLLLVGIVLVTALDQLRTGQITAYIANLLIAGTVLSVRPPRHLLVLGIPHLLFLWLIILFQQDPLLEQANLINGTLLFITIAVVSGFSYKGQFDRHATRRQLERANTNLAYLARYDQLTGLYNRRCFDEKLDQHLSDTEDAGFLVICDVDHFKRINDTHGHPFGDLVLQHIARILSDLLGPKDLIARWGGEEFILYIEDEQQEQALERIKGLRKALDESLLSIEESTIRVTASFGVVSLRGRRVETALRLADDAMYKAKEKGRNRVVLARDAGEEASDDQ